MAFSHRTWLVIALAAVIGTPILISVEGPWMRALKATLASSKAAPRPKGQPSWRWLLNLELLAQWQGWGAVSGGLIVVAAIRARRQRQPIRPALLTQGTTVGVFIVAALTVPNLLKVLIPRQRPSAFDGFCGWESFDLGAPLFWTRLADHRWQSFPSAHTASAFCLAWLVAATWPRRRGVPAMAITLAALVGGCRVLRLAHYPSDVWLGAAVGLAARGLAQWAAATLLATWGLAPEKKYPPPSP